MACCKKRLTPGSIDIRNGIDYQTSVMAQYQILPPRHTRHLARLVFVSFLLTFIASRTLVILIMSRRMPDLFLHLGGTHVHHLNYGIFLLSAVAGLLLFAELSERQKSVCALAYGFSLALTFDEFGMWLHLGGSYWQRASFDAVIVLLSLFGLLAFFPRWRRVRVHHFVVGGVVLAAVISFYVLLFHSLNHANDKLLPRLRELEQKGPQ
jgi:glucose dehydrogenase